MKIEVTHSWTEGAISRTTTVSADMTLSEPATAEEMADFAIVLKQVAERGKLITPAPTINVYLDEAKQAAKKVVEQEAQTVSPSMDRHPPINNSDALSVGEQYDADARLGRMVRKMQNGTNLRRQPCDKWGCEGGLRTAQMCDSPEQALYMCGVKP